MQLQFTRWNPQINQGHLRSKKQLKFAIIWFQITLISIPHSARRRTCTQKTRILRDTLKSKKKFPRPSRSPRPRSSWPWPRPRPPRTRPPRTWRRIFPRTQPSHQGIREHKHPGSIHSHNQRYHTVDWSDCICEHNLFCSWRWQGVVSMATGRPILHLLVFGRGAVFDNINFEGVHGFVDGWVRRSTTYWQDQWVCKDFEKWVSEHWDWGVESMVKQQGKIVFSDEGDYEDRVESRWGIGRGEFDAEAAEHAWRHLRAGEGVQ